MANTGTPEPQELELLTDEQTGLRRPTTPDELTGPPPNLDGDDEPPDYGEEDRG